MSHRTRKNASKPKRVSRFEGLDDEEATRRWQASRPRHLRFLAFFSICTAAIFAYNHFFIPAKQLKDILQVAFQIGLIFMLLFGMLVAMGYAYGRPAAKK